MFNQNYTTVSSMVSGNSSSNGSSSDDNSSSTSILEKNCREEWPVDVCIFANICGLISITIWFIVLFPQLWKNFRRKSVRGLSLPWAIANFSASLVNLFFVFKLKDLPVYVKISAVYMPTLQLVLLVQFWVYGTNYSRNVKLAVTAACVLSWAVLVVVQLTMEVYDAMMWLAIVLWSVQSFPQVILNMKVHSTGGQAVQSVLLALLGKTTDFLSTYLLLLPMQYVVMAYFSSSLCYINGLQVIWYWGQEGKLKEPLGQEEETLSLPLNTRVDGKRFLDEEIGNFSKDEITSWTKVVNRSSPDEKDTNLSKEDKVDSPEEEDGSSSKDHYNLPKDEEATDSWKETDEGEHATPLSPAEKDLTENNLCRTFAHHFRRLCFVFLCLILIGCVVGLRWNTHSHLAVLAPISIIVVLVVARCYQHRPCRKLDFSHRELNYMNERDPVDDAQVSSESISSTDGPAH